MGLTLGNKVGVGVQLGALLKQVLTPMLEITDFSVSAQKTLNTVNNSNLIHGSILYNGFIYGTSRGTDAIGYPHLIIAPEHDIANYTSIQIKINETTPATLMEQIVECGGMLYFKCGGYYLGQYNPNTNTYKVFKIQHGGSTEPYVTDGQYLYIINSFQNKVSKIDPINFIGDFPQFNTATYFVVPVEAYYYSTTQGGHILGGYSATLKGNCHAAITDDEYLYIAYSSDSGSFGYDETLGISPTELHKIRKSDMTAAGWVKIPQITDDCAQNDTHLFFGIEIPISANPLVYGYGWGTFSLRKSDLKLTALPPYSMEDISIGSVSYGVYMFGSYLFDIKTNGLIYVLNPSDADNWEITEQMGIRNKKIFRYNVPVINELLMSADHTFYAFVWASPAILIEFQLPNLTFT